MSSRSALVTGGSGFIGRHLTTRLLKEGWEVACVGRRDPAIEGARFIAAPSLSFSNMAALRGLRVDAVFHLAAYGVAPKDRDEGQAFSANVAGTAAVVQAAAGAGAEAVVYAGSCSEYAQAEPGHPIPETHPLAAHGLYGPSKAAGGLWGRALANHLGIGFAHMRLFGVYGPGEAPHRLLPSIASRLSHGLAVELSPGEQICDMVHVDDAVDGLLLAETVARRGGGIFNLCSGRPVSIREVALLVADAMRTSRDLLLFGAIPTRAGEPMWLVGDGTAFAETAAFAPRLSLEAGIASAVASARLEIGIGV